ncbi:MAG: pyrimidine dimer DNA glycosylase/endonuclease V [Candidatus Falkowbacteria bacterium]
MRLWSISPIYLDTKGLLAVWREALLAKKVLEGNTNGYKNHPQLIRFKESKDTEANINAYLFGIYLEAESRGYKFSADKIKTLKILNKKIKVNKDQLDYEFSHLLNKLKARDTKKYREIKDIKRPEAHFLFEEIPGGVEKWEIVKDN